MNHPHDAKPPTQEEHAKSRKKKKKSSDDKTKKRRTQDQEVVNKCSKHSRIRRSDRIKVIETIKQHHKELEIAEKIKKLSTTTGVSGADFTSDMIKEEIINDEEQEETEEVKTYLPMKIKERWRRYSEKEWESSSRSPSSLCQTSVAGSPSNSGSPHRAFKKIILDKVVNETSASAASLLMVNTTTTNSETKRDTELAFDQDTLSSLYENIDENLFVTKK